MGALDSLKNLIGKGDTEKQISEAYEQGRNNPNINPTSSVEAAQTMHLMNQGMGGAYELGQLALDSNNDIEEFKSFLRGYRVEQREDNAGNIVLVKVDLGEALMNEKGVNFMVGNLRLYYSKSFLLTNYTSGGEGMSGKIDKAIEMIHVRCKHAAISMIIVLTLKRRDWDIKEQSRLSITNAYTDAVEASLLRSLDDGERRKYYNTQKEVRNINQQQNMNEMNNKRPMFFGG